MHFGIPDDNHVVDMRDTQVRLGKDSVVKGSINNTVGEEIPYHYLLYSILICSYLI